MELSALNARLSRSGNNERRRSSQTDTERSNNGGRNTNRNNVRSALANLNLDSIPFTIGGNGNRLTESCYNGITKRFSKADNNDTDTQAKQQQVKKSQVENDIVLLESFVKNYIDNKTNSTEIRAIIAKNLKDVANIVSTKYFDNKYNNAVVSMNKVLKLMETRLFSTTLIVMVKDGIFEDEWDEIRSDLAGLISIALDTSYSRMRDETVAAYVEIVAEYVYPNEIKEMTTLLGIDEDTAVDIVLAIPYFGKEFTEIQLRNYAPKFWAIINEHSDLLIDTMDATNQMRLFYYIFPDKENNQLKKAIGKCLTYEYLNIPEDNKKAIALYKEYNTALYMMLDELDIEDIQYVLKFVNNEVDKNEQRAGNALVYDESLALHFENIAKAIQN